MTNHYHILIETPDANLSKGMRDLNGVYNQRFDREWILSCFGESKKTAIQGFIQFVTNGVEQPSPWKMLRNQIYLGSEEFIDQVQKKVSIKNLSEIPKIQHRLVPKGLVEYDRVASNRNEAIVLA